MYFRYAKIAYLGIAFILFLQVIGIFSFRSNQERLKSFDPWQPVYSNQKAPLLARWDSGWYTAVARYGYYLNPGQNSTVAFFPLYPLLIKGLSEITPLDFFLCRTAHFLACVAFGFSLFLQAPASGLRRQTIIFCFAVFANFPLELFSLRSLYGILVFAFGSRVFLPSAQTKLDQSLASWFFGQPHPQHWGFAFPGFAL